MDPSLIQQSISIAFVALFSSFDVSLAITVAFTSIHLNNNAHKLHAWITFIKQKYKKFKANNNKKNLIFASPQHHHPIWIINCVHWRKCWQMLAPLIARTVWDMPKKSVNKLYTVFVRALAIDAECWPAFRIQIIFGIDSWIVYENNFGVCVCVCEFTSVSAVLYFIAWTYATKRHLHEHSKYNFIINKYVLFYVDGCIESFDSNGNEVKMQKNKRARSIDIFGFRCAEANESITLFCMNKKPNAKNQ